MDMIVNQYNVAYPTLYSFFKKLVPPVITHSLYDDLKNDCDEKCLNGIHHKILNDRVYMPDGNADILGELVLFATKKDENKLTEFWKSLADVLCGKEEMPPQEKQRLATLMNFLVKLKKPKTELRRLIGELKKAYDKDKALRNLVEFVQHYSPVVPQPLFNDLVQKLIKKPIENKETEIDKKERDNKNKVIFNEIHRKILNDRDYMPEQNADMLGELLLFLTKQTSVKINHNAFFLLLVANVDFDFDQQGFYLDAMEILVERVKEPYAELSQLLNQLGGNNVNYNQVLQLKTFLENVTPPIGTPTLCAKLKRYPIQNGMYDIHYQDYVTAFNAELLHQVLVYIKDKGNNNGNNNGNNKGNNKRIETYPLLPLVEQILCGILEGTAQQHLSAAMKSILNNTVE